LVAFVRIIVWVERLRFAFIGAKSRTIFSLRRARAFKIVVDHMGALHSVVGFGCIGSRTCW
jgi:hypothetical protein